MRARYAPAEPGTKSLKLIAIIEPEKGLACFPVEGEPGAGISTIVDDFDGAHGVARKLGTTHPNPPRTMGHDRITINNSGTISTGNSRAGPLCA